MSKTMTRTMAFHDGELVHDVKHGETFVYNHGRDALRAESGQLRRANAQEKEEFRRFRDPKQP